MYTFKNFVNVRDVFNWIFGCLTEHTYNIDVFVFILKSSCNRFLYRLRVQLL